MSLQGTAQRNRENVQKTLTDAAVSCCGLLAGLGLAKHTTGRPMMMDTSVFVMGSFASPCHTMLSARLGGAGFLTWMPLEGSPVRQEEMCE